ncbi:MAG: hypothetical protein Q7S40_34035 [Opitutaceae bacterium]|nr:hypothetical protein [Opitutaceae bacterium]
MESSATKALSFTAVSFIPGTGGSLQGLQVALYFFGNLDRVKRLPPEKASYFGRECLAGFQRERTCYEED